jgi:hypothetical protein
VGVGEDYFHGPSVLFPGPFGIGLKVEVCSFTNNPVKNLRSGAVTLYVRTPNRLRRSDAHLTLLM